MRWTAMKGWAVLALVLAACLLAPATADEPPAKQPAAAVDAVTPR